MSVSMEKLRSLSTPQQMGRERASLPSSNQKSVSPFGEDSVTLSKEAFQVAQAHLNTPLAIQAAQANPGTWQQYKHSYNGHSGSVRFINGNLEWGK